MEVNHQEKIFEEYTHAGFQPAFPFPGLLSGTEPLRDALTTKTDWNPSETMRQNQTFLLSVIAGVYLTHSNTKATVGLERECPL